MNSEVSNFLASHPFSDATKNTYRRVLESLIRHDTASWSPSDLLAFVQRDKWGNAWQCTALYACRKFLRWLHGKDHPALSAKLKRIKPKPQRSLTYEQVIELLASFDTYTAIGARDQAIAAIALDTGLRVAELARIQLADVDREHRVITVIVKGGQWEFAFYSLDTAAILERWLHFRVPADGVNALFVSLRENKDKGRQITTNGMKAIIKKWSKQLGFPLSGHDFRRSFARLTTRNGAPSRLLQIAGRWSDIKMVEHYTQGIEAQAIEPFLPITHALKRQG